MNNRDKLVYKAKLAEQAERYKEMKQYMSDVARDDSRHSCDVTRAALENHAVRCERAGLPWMSLSRRLLQVRAAILVTSSKDARLHADT